MRSSDDTRTLILVDGRSGAGKSRWAAGAQQDTGFTLISLDDFYPGWDGLDAGHSYVFRHGILPWAQHHPAHLHQWAWDTMTPGEVVTIDPADSLIIEGCGALSALTAPFATDSFWLDAPANVRSSRALARDGDMFAPHWERWALQEERFYKLHASPQRAHHRINT
jgi:uridine kinase